MGTNSQELLDHSSISTQTASPVPAYQYAALGGPRQIRLFKLYSGEDTEPIAGEIEHANLDDCPAYEAISYEWGRPAQEHQILINTEGVLSGVCVTRSLHRALCDLRHVDKAAGHRTIWADALCINQHDMEERQQQVSIMGSVYRDAARVVTYLGPEDEDTGIAIEFLKQFLQPPPGSIAGYGTTFAQQIPPATDARCVAFKKLVLKGWAGRSWCAQEFLLNEKLILMCGRYKMKWYLLPLSILLVFNRSLPAYLLPSSEEDPASLRECLFKLFRMRDQMQRDKQPPKLLKLLSSAYPMRASDPRDKVYSLLGLAADADALQIPINYKCSVESLYTTVAARIAKLHQPIDILYWNLGTKTFNLPSWVPDWSTWRFGTSGMIFGTASRAAGHSRPTMSVVNETTLSVSGCLFDKITFLSERVGPHFTVSPDATPELPLSKGNITQEDDSPAQKTPQTAHFLASMLQTTASLLPYPHHPHYTPEEILWRTLSNSTTLMESPATGAYASHFEAFHACIRERDETLHGQYTGPEITTDQRTLAREFHDNVRRRMRYRRLCVTEKKLFGAVPEEAQVGDWVSIFAGGALPFVLRSVDGKDDEFRLVGPAYVHGVMKGEARLLGECETRMIALV